MSAIPTNEQKRIAQQIVRLAIEAGFIKRGPCAVCGETQAVAHHEDYFKPLDVTFLCEKHHAARHSELEKFEPMPVPNGWILLNQIPEKFGISLFWFQVHRHHFETAKIKRSARSLRGRLMVQESSIRKFLGLDEAATLEVTK